MGSSWQAVCINKTSTTTVRLAQYSSTYDKLKSGTQHVTRSAKNHKVEQSYVYEHVLVLRPHPRGGEETLSIVHSLKI